MQLSARACMSLPLVVLAAGAVVVAPAAAADRGDNSPSLPGSSLSRASAAATTRPQATRAAVAAACSSGACGVVYHIRISKGPTAVRQARPGRPASIRLNASMTPVPDIPTISPIAL